MEPLLVQPDKLQVRIFDHDIPDDVLQQLEQQPLLGIDVETTPKPEFRNDPKGGLDPKKSNLSLLQISDSSGETICLVKKPTQKSKNIIELMHYSVPKVIHYAEFDLGMINYHMKTRVSWPLCTWALSKKLFPDESHKLDALTSAHLGITLNKDPAVRLSDWNGILTAEQLRYAALDAAVLCPLWIYLKKQATPEMMEQVLEDMEDLQ